MIGRAAYAELDSSEFHSGYERRHQQRRLAPEPRHEHVDAPHDVRLGLWHSASPPRMVRLCLFGDGPQILRHGRV